MVYHPDLGYVENGVDLSDADLYKTAVQPFGQATILPPFSYQSKIFSDLEDEKLWTRSWIAIGTTQQIPNTGDLLPFTVGHHGIHVQREEDGSLTGRFNKAQHGGCRAVPLQCQTGKKTKCSFTSCGYSRDQHAIPVEAIGENSPTMHQYLGLIPERLLPIKVETLGPFIFVNLDPDSCSLKEAAGNLPAEIDTCAIEQLTLHTDEWFECESNWKLAGRAFYDSEHINGCLSIHDHATAPNHFHASDLSIPELTDLKNNTLEKTKLFWLFPNLLLVNSPTHILCVILQPTSMRESLLRTCIFNKKEIETSDTSSPTYVQKYIQSVQSRAKSFQQMTDKLTSVGAPELTDDMIPIEQNVAGYIFHRYVTKQIGTEHEYYWNAPLYTINPIA